MTSNFSWEDSSGFFESLKALSAACGHILFKPFDFFKRLADGGAVDRKKRLIRAFVFAIILGYIKLLFDVANIYWLRYFSKELFPLTLQSQINFLSVSVLSSPVFLLRPVVVLLLTLALLVVGVKLILGFDKALMPVFLVVCYKSAADLFYCLPMVGGVFAAVWSLALVIIGIKESYRVSLGRSVLSGVMMPLLILLFFILSLGPSLNRVVAKLYPEVQVQMMKLNDVTAYVDVTAVVSAAQTYKKELGFYPDNLGALKKYLQGPVANDVTDPRNSSGYVYFYVRPDDAHFILKAWPVKMQMSGGFVFHADETGSVRLNDRDGRVIRDVNDMENLVVGPKEEKLSK